MKKLITIVLIFCAFLNLNAQDESGSGGKLYFGVKAGIGMVNFESTLKDEKNFADRTYNNMAYGITAGFNINANISIQVEGNYAQYRADNILKNYVYSAQSPVLYNYNENVSIHHVDMILSTVDVPLLCKFALKEDGFSPVFLIGANWGINVMGKANITRKIVDKDGTHYRVFTDDITNRINYYEFAPVAGVGFRMNMDKMSLNCDVRYKYGIQNLSNIDNNLGFVNRAFWLSLGLNYNL